MPQIHASQTILAIHGSASSGKQWRGLQTRTAPQMRCIAPTTPDADAGTRLAHLKNALGDADQVHVIAHSFGASLAMKLVNDCPDRIATVTLYDPVVRLHDGMADDLQAVFDDMIRHGPETGTEVFLDFWAGPGDWARSTDRRRASLIARYASVLNDFGQMAAGDWVPSDAVFSGPMTILSGDTSPTVIQSTAGYLAKTYPQAQSHILPGFNHMTPLTQPDRMEQILIGCVMGHLANERRPIAA